MEDLVKEILENIKIRQNGIEVEYYDYAKKDYIKKLEIPNRGKGTKSYIIRRIDILQDQLRELKKDVMDGKYDYKEKE